MLDAPNITAPAPPGHRLRSLLSLLSLALALVLLGATFFLMSPPAGASYPGAVPWREGSILKAIRAAPVILEDGAPFDWLGTTSGTMRSGDWCGGNDSLPPSSSSV